MRAVLSDIHGNLEALDAVLADIARHGVTEICCLGDLVGYGPNPVECVERSMGWDVVVLGNHDRAVLVDPDGWNEGSIFWTKAALEAARRQELWGFLASRSQSHLDDQILHVHGSPRSPIHEYVYPEDIYNERKMTRIGEVLTRYCLCGHTHVPGVFVENDPGAWEYHAIEERHWFWRFDGRKTIVNVGSVGQPRDNDWRACYALLDGWDVTFRRVEYDVETTVQKIYAIPGLENFLGDRLREGR